ncbi:MAG: hypothetical protein M3Q84_07020 [Actinomycetota bacterium]|nr:hypothetical protein [Actinomycetota bacterium]
MNKWSVISSLVLAASIAGCERKNGSADATAPSTPAPSTPAPAATPSTGDVAAGTSTSGTSVRSPADAPADTPAEVRQVRSHIADANRHLKNKSPDLARQSLEEAERVQKPIPVEVQEELGQLRTRIAAAAAIDAPPVGGLDDGIDEENK